MRTDFAHTTIKVDPDVLIEKAREIEKCASTMEDIFDQLYNLLLAQKESGAWEGIVINEAVRVTSKNIDRYASLSADMEELADYLRRVSTKMANVDEEIKAEICAIA